jgi:hypothetical protein
MVKKRELHQKSPWNSPTESYAILRSIMLPNSITVKNF